jgi:hypothetical protein
MLVPACESRCAREGASSEADLARGGREPSSEADLARGGALLGRSGGPLWWAAGVITAWAVLCVYVLCYVRGVFVFCVFCRFYA